LAVKQSKYIAAETIIANLINSMVEMLCAAFHLDGTGGSEEILRFAAVSGELGATGRYLGQTGPGLQCRCFGGHIAVI
jgi:hypothetical protein